LSFQTTKSEARPNLNYSSDSGSAPKSRNEIFEIWERENRSR